MSNRSKLNFESRRVNNSLFPGGPGRLLLFARWALRKLASGIPPSSLKNKLFSLSGIVVGKKVFIGEGVRFIDGFIPKEIELGDCCVISPNVTIISLSYPNTSNLRMIESLVQRDKVKVGSQSWIGSNSTLLPGTTVEASSVIGAGSLVKHHVKTGEIWAGNPARFLKKIELND